jgi:hypothetical protein
MKILRPMRDVVTEDWRKLHNETLHIYSLNIIGSSDG